MLKSIRYLIALGVAWSIPQAFAYNFKPTEAEFLAWPKFCQVVYLRTSVGHIYGEQFSRYVTQQDVQAADHVLMGYPYGDFGVHHFCAGTTWINRARVSDPSRTKFEFQQAFNETSFSLNHMAPDHPYYPMVAGQMATILIEQGKNQEALKLLDKAIEGNPKNAQAYSMKGVTLYRQKQYGEARKVLEAGNEQLSGRSPEILYNLGLVLIELNELDLAQQYARQAYALGYPLPGLKNRLSRLGHWE